MDDYAHYDGEIWRICLNGIEGLHRLDAIMVLIRERGLTAYRAMRYTRKLIDRGTQHDTRRI